MRRGLLCKTASSASVMQCAQKVGCAGSVYELNTPYKRSTEVFNSSSSLSAIHPYDIRLTLCRSGHLLLTGDYTHRPEGGRDVLVVATLPCLSGWPLERYQFQTASKVDTGSARTNPRPMQKRISKPSPGARPPELGRSRDAPTTAPPNVPTSAPMAKIPSIRRTAIQRIIIEKQHSTPQLLKSGDYTNYRGEGRTT